MRIAVFVLMLFATISLATQVLPPIRRFESPAIVVVSDGKVPANLKLGTIVRLTEEGPAGTVFFAASEGGFLTSASRPLLYTKGGKFLVGGASREFEFRAFRTGRARILITSTTPGKPKVSLRDITVEVD